MALTMFAFVGCTCAFKVDQAVYLFWTVMSCGSRRVRLPEAEAKACVWVRRYVFS